MTGKLRKRITHIGKLLVLALGIYGIWSFISNCILEHISIVDWVEAYFPLSRIAEKIFFGTFFCGPMWFIYALFWGYIFLYFSIKKFGIEKLFVLVPIILVFHILVRVVIKGMFENIYNVAVFRSFILYAIPYILLGSVIAKFNRRLWNRISNRSLVIVAIIGCLVQFAEYAMTRQSLDFYFGTIIYSFSLFVLAVNNRTFKYGRILKYIGNQLSLYVYLLHMLVIEILNIITNTWSGGQIAAWWLWLRPILAVMLSIALSWTIVYIRKLFGQKNYGS